MSPRRAIISQIYYAISTSSNMAFLVELWESIFTPGTSPALLKATHASFILLLLSLLSLIFYTRSIHFINLFVIALLLYASVIWFVHELQNAKLKDNEELAKKEGERETDNETEGKEVEGEKEAKGTATAVKQTPQIKKRKA